MQCGIADNLCRSQPDRCAPTTCTKIRPSGSEVTVESYRNQILFFSCHGFSAHGSDTSSKEKELEILYIHKSMCHAQKTSHPKQQVDTRCNTSNIQIAVFSQDIADSTCNYPFPAPRKFTREAAVRKSIATPQHMICTSKDSNLIASCKSALGRNITSTESALWERKSNVQACLDLSLDY